MASWESLYDYFLTLATNNTKLHFLFSKLCSLSLEAHDEQRSSSFILPKTALKLISILNVDKL